MRNGTTTLESRPQLQNIIPMTHALVKCVVCSLYVLYSIVKFWKAMSINRRVYMFGAFKFNYFIGLTELRKIIILMVITVNGYRLKLATEKDI